MATFVNVLQRPSPLIALQYTGSNAQDFIDWSNTDPHLQSEWLAAVFTAEGSTGLHYHDFWGVDTDVPVEGWVLLNPGAPQVNIFDDATMQAAYVVGSVWQVAP